MLLRAFAWDVKMRSDKVAARVGMTDGILGEGAGRGRRAGEKEASGAMYYVDDRHKGDWDEEMEEHASAFEDEPEAEQRWRGWEACAQEVQAKERKVLERTVQERITLHELHIAFRENDQLGITSDQAVGVAHKSELLC